MIMREIIQTLSKVKELNSQKIHYEAPYLSSDDMENIEYALEKQISKKRTYEGDGYAPDGTFVWDEWLCPNCGSRYEVDYDDYAYCPNCGQKIDEERDY